MSRLVVADDSAAFREGFAALLMSLPGFELVGEAASADEAIVVTARVQPDLVVMDLDMPGGGIHATRRIVEGNPHVKVLVMSMLDDPDGVFAAVAAGASGYVVKGAGQQEVRRALEGVLAGEAVFGPAVARRVLARMAATPEGLDPAVLDPAIGSLSDRERDVLELLAAGHDTVGVARATGLAVKTVRNHISAVLTKLQVADRTQAVLRARDAGLGPKS